MVRRICEITVTLDFIFLLVHCSSEDDSYNSICLNVLEGIKQFYLLMWFKKIRLETPFKGDNVKALVKTSICENLVLYFSEKVQKIASFAIFFWFSVTKQSFENSFCFPQWSEIPTLPASLKIKRHFSTTAAFGKSVFFKWKILSDDQRFYIHNSKWNSRSDVDGLTHTKQLLNLVCIVYICNVSSCLLIVLMLPDSVEKKKLAKMLLIKSICPIWTYPWLKEKWLTPKWNAAKCYILCIFHDVKHTCQPHR